MTQPGSGEAGMLDHISNQRFRQLSSLMAQSRTELFGLLDCDLFFQGKLLLNGVNVKIELMCITDSFCLISSPAAGTGHYICLAVCEENAGGTWSAFGEHWGLLTASAK